MSSQMNHRQSMNVEGASTNLGTIFELIAMISPVMIVFFIVMISIFNQNVKGLVYLGGMLLAMLVNIITVRAFKSVADESIPNPTCAVFDFPGFIKNRSSSVNCLVIAFTAVYISAPMFIEGGNVNISVIIAMTLFYLIDVILNMTKGCTTPRGIIIGTFIGLFCGGMWFAIFNSANKNLLFFNELIGDKYYCDKPSKQTFKCKVFKNGEVIGTV